MNIEKLKREVEMNSYTENPNSLIRVIDVDDVLELIDELANNNESIDLVVGSDEWKTDLHAKTQAIKNPKKTTMVKL